ncbi:MAG: hypothetical protein H7301_12310 [Cryobacterium sp.]|nr:hypothetical protein [Oligoflexia bacterium]
MMTFAELIFFIAVVLILYRLMSPLQRVIELRLRKFFKSKNKKSDAAVIDITDYSKNKNRKE